MAVAASPFVLPVRSVDVLRKRAGEALRTSGVWLRDRRGVLREQLRALAPH